MSIKVRIDPIDREVNLIIDELLSPAGRSKQFANGAAVFLAEADDINRQALGRVPKSKTYVDGHQGAPLIAVRPDGIIIREYDMLFDVVLFVADWLRRNSPINRKPDKRPGHPGFYQRSHTLFADGKEVMANGPLTVGQIPDASEYVFLSVAAYARRLENRYAIYEMGAAKAHSQFKNIARVSFGWRTPVATRNNKENRASRVPAIIVTMGR